MALESSEVTQLLHAWRAGDRDAENRLFEAVLPDLRRLAQHYMRGERSDHSMEPTDLVDQIYVKLVRARDRDWQSRGHFFAVAARAMRRYLIDYARCRPDVELVPIDKLPESFHAHGSKVELAVNMDQMLDVLDAEKPEWCTIVEMKFFLGLTDEEAADVLGMHVRKLQRDWQDARKWLFQRLNPKAAGEGA